LHCAEEDEPVSKKESMRLGPSPEGPKNPCGRLHDPLGQERRVLSAVSGQSEMVDSAWVRHLANIRSDTNAEQSIPLCPQ
jgi:hypothetical protein